MLITFIFHVGHDQGEQILVSSKVLDETAFPKASWRVRVAPWWVEYVEGRDALGKAVSAGDEPRIVAERQNRSLNQVTLVSESIGIEWLEETCGPRKESFLLRISY